MLVHHADTKSGCFGRGPQLKWLTLEHYPPGIGLKNPAENFHEHALTGAVLADQREYFAFADLNRRGGVRHNPAESFADVLHSQDRRARARHSYAFQ